MTDYLERAGVPRLAYRYTPAVSGPTFVWLSGFKSDMSGSKVTVLEAWAKTTGCGFLAFDYRGHGLSDGQFEDGTISDWRADALAAIDALTDGPLILVGSSMGGWIALLATLELKSRVSAMVLIAPAPDFTEKLMWPDFSTDQQAELMDKGMILRPSDYDAPYTITRALIEDGRTWSLLDEPIPFHGPVRILQGMQDTDVPWRHAYRLVEALESEDVVFTLVKDGDHRLSRDQDLERLVAVCADLIS
ncbi:MAG: alpha/beta hydrolase [Henriciella sp.]